MKKIGSLYVSDGVALQSEGPRSHQISVKSPWEGRLASYFRRVVADNPENGNSVVARLMKRISDLVEESFFENRAPMRNPTKAEMLRRIDICVDICLACAHDERSAILKIIDELPDRLWEKLGIAEEKTHRRNSWGTTEKISVDLDLLKGA